jgi:hypothetical protein
MSEVPATVCDMALVVMLKDLDTAETVGTSARGEDGWRTTAFLHLEDFEGLGGVASGAAWPRWEGRRVDATVAHTESHPSGVWWLGSCLTAALADELFGNTVPTNA